MVCHFSTHGFLGPRDIQLRACGVAYHHKCLPIGPPFTCWRRNQEGLYFPMTFQWPLFICKCCTVRAVTGWELGTQGNANLLRLEWVWLLGLANSWSQGTRKAYALKLCYLAQFEAAHHGVKVLSHPILKWPPCPSAIPLVWAELEYSLWASPQAGRDRVVYGTVCQLCSAAGCYHTISMLKGRWGHCFMMTTARFSNGLIYVSAMMQV